jgi:hybrid cluster-associated redox disulfide protein
MEMVNEKTLVGEIVMKHPEACDVLMSIGMHCLGCPASQAESLEDACMVHGFEVAPVVDAINERIAAAN